MYLSFFIMSVPTSIVSFVISIGALAFFDLPMTIILLATVIVIVYLNSRSRRTVRTMTANFMETESSVSRYVADMMRGCRAIKLYAIENHVSDNFEQHLGDIRQKGAYLSLHQWIENAKPEMAHYVGMAVIYLYGAYSCVYRDLSVGKFMAFVTCVGSVMGPLMSYLQSNLLKANAEAGLERIQRILDTENSTPESLSTVSFEKVDQEAMAQQVPCIEFDQVKFSYDGTHYLFDGLSCRIRHGESVALVGPSGSGKSSFANLALRLFDPQSGEIRINGTDIKQYALQDLRSRFGVVPQDPFLFQTSIYDNIRAAVPQASEEEVRSAMKSAYVDDFVDQLPEGVKTLVGEAGVNLSGGQRQRIAIARALLAKPKILIFDEATSALDNESEHRIQKSIEELMVGRTVIIIAHRLSTIRRVDRILVFEKGKVVQEGSYAELSERPGLFQDLLDRSREE
jgi:ABC-type multidrug transport system fused ATPase/permease subunit